jgi:hypothetical protein
LQLAREQKEARVAVAVQKMRNELEAVKHHEIIDDPEMDVPYDLDAEPDEQELEAMMDLFDGPKRPSRKNKKTPKKENKPKGPEQLELF